MVTKSFEGHNGIDSTTTNTNTVTVAAATTNNNNNNGRTSTSREGNSKGNSAPNSRVATSHSQHRHPAQSSLMSPMKEGDGHIETSTTAINSINTGIGIGGLTGEGVIPMFSPAPPTHNPHGVNTNTAPAAAAAAGTTASAHTHNATTSLKPLHVEGVVMFDFSRVGMFPVMSV